MSDYIPRQDADAILWFEAFRNNIVANPAAYGLTVADANAINTVVTAFGDALTVSSNEATRTKGTIAAKDDARVTAEVLCRQYAMDIKNNEGVTDQDKINAGVRPINPDRTPIPVPTTSPALEVIASTPGVQTIKYSDPINGDSKAKPFGAAALQLFVGVADAGTIITDWNDCEFYGAFTRTPIGVQFDPSQNGKQATYYARWASKNGDTGPFSAPATLAIAA